MPNPDLRRLLSVLLIASSFRVVHMWTFQRQAWRAVRHRAKQQHGRSHNFRKQRQSIYSSSPTLYSKAGDDGDDEASSHYWPINNYAEEMSGAEFNDFMSYSSLPDPSDSLNDFVDVGMDLTAHDEDEYGYQPMKFPQKSAQKPPQKSAGPVTASTKATDDNILSDAEVKEAPDQDSTASSGGSKPSVTAQAADKTNKPNERGATTKQSPMPGKRSHQESTLEQIDLDLESLEVRIFEMNDGKEFKVGSPKQVSMALFGIEGRSTNKSTLEGIAHQNPMAGLILEHRSLKYRRARVIKTKEAREAGTHVFNIMTQTKPKRSPKAAAASKKPIMSKVVADVAPNAGESKKRQVVRSKDPLLLVDASAYIFRAYHSMPPMHRGDGMPVGAVLGFCNMLNRMLLNRMLNQERPRLVLVFDAPGPTFRNEIYPLYKAQRPDVPVDLIPQFSLIREAGRAYGIPQVEAAGFEADDVIATLACKATQMGMDVNILSGDKDLMQLITPNASDSDGGIGVCQMIDPMKMSRVDHDAVVEKWNVNSDQLGDVLALAGDAADNVPGVPGIGPKIAAQLINEYGSLDGIYENVDDIKQKKRRETLMENEDQARLSRVLVELERDVPFGSMIRPADETAMDADELSVMRMTELDVDRVISFYDDMDFYTIKRTFLDKMKRSNFPYEKLQEAEERSYSAIANHFGFGGVGSEPMPKREYSTSARSAAVGGNQFYSPTQKKRAYTPKDKADVPAPEDYDNVPF